MDDIRSSKRTQKRKINKLFKQFMEECYNENDTHLNTVEKVQVLSEDNDQLMLPSSDCVQLNHSNAFVADKFQNINTLTSSSSLFSDGGSSNQIDTSLFKSIDQHQSFDFWEDDSSGRFDNDDESDEGTENTDINSQLAEWAIKFNISLAALSALLIILRLHNLSLSKDPRTLLSTPFNFVVQNISEGTFCYRGIQKGINSILRKCNNIPQTLVCLHMHINIDGLPLFKSNNIQLWPILGLIKEFRSFGPFVIGLFAGMRKPPLEKYLEDFIHEMKSLANNALVIDDRVFSLVLDAIICDAPARAFIKGVKSHSGYHSCERCIQQGEWNGRVYFSASTAHLRTDESFNKMLDDDHHIRVSPFTQLNIGLVSRVVLDYMHLL